jgi:hypothetical protein
MAHRSRNARLLSTALAAAVWSLPAPHAHAAPFVTFSLVGRLYGSSDAFSSVVRSPSSGAIEYQVVVDMAATGTVNVQGTIARTITSLTVGTDGINSVKLDIFESASQAVQLSFDSPATLNPDPSPLANDSWAAGTGARGGTPTARPGQPAYNDLIEIRPIHAAGVFTAINPEIMISGVCSMDTSSGSTSLIQMRFSPLTNLEGMKINGGAVVFADTDTESSGDPLTAYNSMTVHVPEPASALLAGIAALGLLARRPSRNNGRRD